MKHIITNRSYFLILCFFLGTLVSLSQTSTIDWSADSDLVNTNGVDLEVTSDLTKQGTTFIWEQIDSDTRSFTISSAKGNWDTQTKLGELNYSLTVEGTIASLTVTGSAEGIFISLNIVHLVSGDPDENYVFNIKTLTNL